MPFFNFSQISDDKFYEIAEEIEALLNYRDKSPNQLRDLLHELEKHSEGKESLYEGLKNRCDNYILPTEIKLVRSDVFNKRLTDAAKKTIKLKSSYPYKAEINNLEKYVDRKIYKSEKKKFLRTKPTILSIEPSFSLLSQEVSTKQFSFSNLYPVYSLGIYSKLGIKPKVSLSSRPKFSYSQIGLRFEYRDTNYMIMPDTSLLGKPSPSFHTQLSFLVRKTVGFDIGILSYSKSNLPTFYSFSTSLFIPMGYFSLGVNSRLLSDFKTPEILVQLGATLKLNIGLYKPYFHRDKEEVKSQVIKLKESI